MSEKYISVFAAVQAKPEFLNENHENKDSALYAKGWNACNKEYIDNLLDIPPADVRPAWISTETDPPKIGEPVLIARKIRHNETVLVEPAVLRPDGNWKAIGHKIKSSSVRYWMPMPEPPKEETE